MGSGSRVVCTRPRHMRKHRSEYIPEQTLEHLPDVRRCPNNIRIHDRTHVRCRNICLNNWQSFVDRKRVRIPDRTTSEPKSDSMSQHTSDRMPGLMRKHMSVAHTRRYVRTHVRLRGRTSVRTLANKDIRTHTRLDARTNVRTTYQCAHVRQRLSG